LIEITLERIHATASLVVDHAISVGFAGEAIGIVSAVATHADAV